LSVLCYKLVKTNTNSDEVVIIVHVSIKAIGRNTPCKVPILIHSFIHFKKAEIIVTSLLDKK
jgi:hypothetical protein